MSVLTRISRRIARDLRKLARLRKVRQMGIAYTPPNFIYWPRLTTDSVVIDGGSSYQADFSILMMERHGAKSYAVDPTRKHLVALEELATRFHGRLVHLPLAIGPEEGVLRFHESDTNESGSLMSDHTNIVNDSVSSYDVRCITLKGLLEEVGCNKIALLKLDIEGAEYPLLNNASGEELSAFEQIFVEFHHHAVSSYDQSDTQHIVSRFSQLGYEHFSLDDHNYLFWKSRRDIDL